jgi:alkylhydroperoxidase family enzyme
VSPRIEPLEAPFPEDVAPILAKMMPSGVPPIALFRTFARNPTMSRAMREWGGYELGKSLSLNLRDREIAIDRTCARCGCEYEWGVHVVFFAERALLTREHLESLTHGGPNDSCWASDRDRDLIAAVDALHDHADIDDDLWKRLTRHFNEQQLLDLMMLCGWYHAISFCARAARTPLEPGAPRFTDFA